MKFHMDNRAQRMIDIFDLKNKQVNISITNSTDHVVAYHMHKYRKEWFYCIKGSFMVALADDRPMTKCHHFRYLSDKDPCKYIEVSPLIYHGYRALEPGSIMLYYMDRKYDQSDEYRIPYDHFGASWETENK